MPRSPAVTVGLVAAALFALAACSGHKATEAEAANAATPPSAASRHKSVFDDQLKALDRAKAVEKQLREDKEKADQAIEDAGG